MYTNRGSIYTIRVDRKPYVYTDFLTNCTDCAPGYFTNKTEQRFCLGCDAGQYSDKSGMHLCLDCPNGFFQDSKRMNSCINKNTCPSEKSEVNEKKTACIKPNWKTAGDCGDNQYLNNVFISQLNWTCLECPDGGDCNGPVTISTLLPKEGWWPIPLNQRKSPVIMFAECLYPSSCLLNASKFKCDIELGYQNNSRLCHRCKKNYKRAGSDQCAKCPEPAANVLIQPRTIFNY